MSVIDLKNKQAPDAKRPDGKPDDNAHLGIAIWASESEEVDAKIKQQIKAGVFPVRLQSKDWTSGKINWLLDVVAPNAKFTEGVVDNIHQTTKELNLIVHPRISVSLKRAGRRVG